MLIADKRIIAKECLLLALNGNYKLASKKRQSLYCFNYIGSIGVDWTNWDNVWATDKKYLQYLESEDFSDLDNSSGYINCLKAVLYVDYLFTFRDAWSVNQLDTFNTEPLNCSRLEEFLRKNRMDFKSLSRVTTYINTKKKNISARMYYDSFPDGYVPPYQPKIYKDGEYDLGYIGEPSPRVLEGRRKFLEDYDEYNELRQYGIEKFPKTFKTFEKHKRENSDKYKDWIKQKEEISK